MASPLPYPPLVRISLRAVGSARCLPAALLTGSAGLGGDDLTGLVVVPVTVLTPPLPSPPRRRRSQLVHSGDRIVTTLVSLRKPVRRRSSIRTRPSPCASRSAFFTLERPTPASAAMWSMASRHEPHLATSRATTARTACSARVNRHAICGGSRPAAAQERRRAIDA